MALTPQVFGAVGRGESAARPTKAKMDSSVRPLHGAMLSATPVPRWQDLRRTENAWLIASARGSVNLIPAS
jgi:hypothetical protein